MSLQVLKDALWIAGLLVAGVALILVDVNVGFSNLFPLFFVGPS